MEVNEITGLTSEQVKSLNKEGKTNYVKIVSGKSYFQIIKDNVFTFFNVLLYVIAGLMIYGGYYDSLFFIGILTCNIIIGLYEDIKARHLMDKMKISTAPKAKVIRDGKQIVIPCSEIVLGDTIVLETGDKISVDGKIIYGTISVNEALLTGEADDVSKNIGSSLLSGTYVTSGLAYMVAERVGKDSYSNFLSQQAKKFKRSPSVILRSLRHLFKVIGGIVIVIGVATIILYAVQGQFSTPESFKKVIGPISGSMVGMIPCGLYLLTSTALAVGVISLGRKGARVQDFYSVEMLARCTTLCIDKTGTITDGTMSLVKVINLCGEEERRLKHITSDFLRATGDKNSTAQALLKDFNLEPYYKAVNTIPFNSKNKFSAVEFDNNRTVILGAPEFINYTSQDKIQNTINEFTDKGYRVLLLAYNKEHIVDNKVTGDFHPLCLFILKDNIKPNVKATLGWFKQNGVKVKVISGDNALTVSKIAKIAGVENYDNYISLEGKSNEEVKRLALQYTVFGRVTPEQKECIVTALKEAKEVVAMTGDGVNDILALKKADCSISMANGADATRDASHIVLMDNDFDSLPKVVGEGRRVVNNLQRTCSLFLVKTAFTMTFSIIFLLSSAILNNPAIKYPFLTNNMYLWEFASIGLSSFFIALEPNAEMIEGKFMNNILKKAIPAAVTMILCTAIPFILYLLNTNLPLYFEVFSIEKAAGMASIIFTIVGLFVLLKVCTPIDRYRSFVFLGAAIVNVVGLMLCILFSIYKAGWNFLKIDFNTFSIRNWLDICVVSLIGIGAYFVYFSIVDIFKKKSITTNNKKEETNEN